MDDCHLGYITKLKKKIHTRRAQNSHLHSLLDKNKSPPSQWVVCHVQERKVSAYHENIKCDLTSNDN
jgi:hypothetical protein